MPENLVIIVLLGSRTAAKEFQTTLSQATETARNGKSANTARETPVVQRQIKLIPGYHKIHPLSPRRQESLLEIERDVGEQLKNIHATSSNVAAILYMCSERHFNPTAFPFNRDSSFLGFSGSTLFNKLTIVPAAPGSDLESRFYELVERGMRILTFEKQPNIAPVRSSEILLPRILARVSQGIDVVRGQIEEIYKRAAVTNRRNAGQAVILLVGETLHGKSKTINRLIGRSILPVASGVYGSMTKDIQRVSVHVTSKEIASTVTVAFDDTPGFQSKTQEDRSLNETLMQRYKAEYFDGTFPNVILLLATWESVLLNAENESPHITSIVGRSMYSLRSSGLVDNERPNVVVVITKSLTSPDESVDLRDKNHCIKSSRIVDLEDDGELSHENLYDAIRTIVEHRGPHEIGDLAGIQALQVLSGAQPLGQNVRTDTQVLVRVREGAVETSVLKFHPPSPDEKTAKLVASYFGVTYDITQGTFGRTSVLNLANLWLRLALPVNQADFEQLAKRGQSAQTSDKPNPERLRAQYSSDWGFQSALHSKPRCYIYHHIIEVVTVDPATLEFSQDIRDEIENLPKWSSGSTDQYMRFFTKYGTHIVSKLALGGTLRVLVRSEDQGQRDNVMVFSDGAGAVASELTAVLEQKFRHPLNPSDWGSIRSRWIEELARDPVFCLDHKLTEYQPIYAVSSLKVPQKEDLQKAYKVYVSRNGDRGVPGTRLQALSRQSNLTRAVTILRDSVTQAFMKLVQG
ncbi:hypothetical protein B0H13DRAFT_2348576 [Mycena leptocephala]|nr:hypothetical protein B0H13DRAFT_2348576 [Mycena leptocephala]